MHEGERKGKPGDSLHHVYETLGGARYVIRYCQECMVLHKENLGDDEIEPNMPRFLAPLRAY